MTPPNLALLIFALTYWGFLIFTHHRGLVAMLGMAAVLALGVVSTAEAMAHVPWTVLMIFVGVLLLAEALILSRLPNLAAERIVQASPNAGVALVLLCFGSSLLSIFIENVACVLIMAPLGIAISRQLKVSPIYPLIGIAIASNLQGCGTLIGDPPSMLLAAELKLNFNQFFWLDGRPSIFWGVQVGAAASLVVLYLFFRGHREAIEPSCEKHAVEWWPFCLLVALVVGLFGLSLQQGELTAASGVYCLAIAVLSGHWIYRCHPHEFWPKLRQLDYQTFFFLLGSFVVVYALQAHAWLDRFAALIERTAGTQTAVLFVLIIGVSILLSAVVANEPYLIAMLPVTGKLAAVAAAANFAGDAAAVAQLKPLYYFGLLLGASLGGNITPVGAAACVVAYGILRREGEPVRFGHFLKLGLPFTLVAVGAGSAFLWLVWAP